MKMSRFLIETMTVTLDYASLDGRSNIIAPGTDAQKREVVGGRDVRLIPGNTVSFTARITASVPVDVNDVLPDGTIETKTVHGFIKGQALHICFFSGISPSQLTPYVIVKDVISDNRFTIEDTATPPVKIILKKENDITVPAAAQPKLIGWVARAANLSGFSGAIVLDLSTGRQDELLGTASIRKGEKQMSIKGSWNLRRDDEITVGSFKSCVIMHRQVTLDDGCYTIVQLGKAAPADIKFSDGKFAQLRPYEPLITGLGYGDQYGWVNVTLPGSKTWVLADYKKPTIDNCPQYVGTFRMELRGFIMEYPEWFTNIPQCEDSSFVRVIDWGRIWI